MKNAALALAKLSEYNLIALIESSGYGKAILQDLDLQVSFNFNA